MENSSAEWMNTEFEFNSINLSSNAFIVKLTFKFVNWSLEMNGMEKTFNARKYQQTEYRWIFIKESKRKEKWTGM